MTAECGAPGEGALSFEGSASVSKQTTQLLNSNLDKGQARQAHLEQLLAFLCEWVPA